MSRIINYAVIPSDSMENLEDKVEDFIKAGWQPFGNLVVMQDIDGCFCYRQAMVLREGYEVDND